MSDELKIAIYTAVEISVFSLLVLIIVFFGGYAKDALVIKNNQDASIREITEYRDLYEIDKGNRIDITKKAEITPSNYKKLKETHLSGAEYNNVVIKYDNWLGENTSSIITGEDILNYISKKGGKYDIIIKFTDSTTFSNVFKVDAVMTYTDLLQKYGLGVNDKYNSVFIYSPGMKIRIKPEAQNENLIFFLRECMGGLITSEFYCSSIFDSTDNTYLAVVFKIKE